MKPNIFMIILLVLILAIGPASATITITPADVTTSSILWTWDPVTVQNLSIDGIYVCNFNPTATSFTLSGLGPGEPHTIEVITAGDSGINTTYTLTSTTQQKGGDLLTALMTWIYLIIIVVLMGVGIKRGLNVLNLIAVMVAIFAEYEWITTNVIDQGMPLIEIPFIMYLIFIVVPLWIFLKRGATN